MAQGPKAPALPPVIPTPTLPPANSPDRLDAVLPPPHIESPGDPGQVHSPNAIRPAVGKPDVLPQPKPEQPGKADQVPVLPPPKPFEPFGPRRPRLPVLPEGPRGLGKTPTPGKAELEKFSKYIQEVIDPENTLDLIVGRPRLIKLKQTPKRIQIADEEVATYNIIEPREITVLGRKVGTTVLNLWFTDPKEAGKEVVLSYLVRVLPDPEAKERLERVYKALADEINRVFPDSFVELELVGDKLVVRGQAKDIVEATQILRVVRANAPPEDAAKIPVESIQLVVRPGDVTSPAGTPGLQDFLTAGGPNVINLLRIPGEQQVMLKVTVAEVNRAAARSIGLNFSVTNDQGLTVFQNLTGNINTGGTNFAAGGILGQQGQNLGNLAQANLPVLLDNGQVSLAINALRNINYARSLAEPNLVAMNGQTATFLAGGQFPVPVVTGFTAAGLQGVSFVPFGVQLAFTPYITDRDRIRLTMTATVSTREIGTGSIIAGAAVPGLTTRNFQTTVELRDGQSLAVAGLIQNNLGADATRVPLIGDLPILNHLTGFDRISAGEQELVVLVTPVLVHPMDLKEVPALPGSDLFEPSDLEFYLLGRLESRRSYDFRSPVMTDWDRMRSYRHCERIYIFGPHGHHPTP